MNGPSYPSRYCDGPLFASKCLNKEVVSASSTCWESIVVVSEFDELYDI